MSARAGSGTPRIELFTTGPACGLCEQAWGHLLALESAFCFVPAKVQLTAHTPVPADYLLRAPVIHVEGRAVLEGRIDAAALRAALEAAGVPAR